MFKDVIISSCVSNALFRNVVAALLKLQKYQICMSSEGCVRSSNSSTRNKSSSKST